MSIGLLICSCEYSVCTIWYIIFCFVFCVSNILCFVSRANAKRPWFADLIYPRVRSVHREIEEIIFLLVLQSDKLFPYYFILWHIDHFRVQFNSHTKDLAYFHAFDILAIDTKQTDLAVRSVTVTQFRKKRKCIDSVSIIFPDFWISTRLMEREIIAKTLFGSLVLDFLSETKTNILLKMYTNMRIRLHKERWKQSNSHQLLVCLPRQHNPTGEFVCLFLRARHTEWNGNSFVIRLYI